MKQHWDLFNGRILITDQVYGRADPMFGAIKALLPRGVTSEALEVELVKGGAWCHPPGPRHGMVATLRPHRDSGL